jgi:multiple sugar transport system substrate-binding protein
MTRLIRICIAAALILAPLSVQGADLVVWWEQGFYPQEDEALREIIAAFEQKTGKEVELVQPTQDELPAKAQAAVEAGQPPDFVFGLDASPFAPVWAFDDRLQDLSKAIGSFANMFDPKVLDHVVLLNGSTGRKALYGLPVGQGVYFIHVWSSLLEQAGFTLADVPRDWEGFWSFWCDRVQPAVRRATGRDDVWGVGLPMSTEAFDTNDEFLQFVTVFEADYVTPDGELVIDRPEIRQGLVEAMDSYTGIYRGGCIPPDAVTWTDSDNNRRFHDQSLIMTLNPTLSIPNALRRERPDDYFENVATIEWPVGPSGEAFPIVGYVASAVVFREGANVAAAEEFVRFLVAEGWLMHYLNLSAERLLPAIPALLDQPFWLDPSDPHRMAAVMQVASRPLVHDYAVASGDRRYDRIRYHESVWAKAIHRVAADGISPEQAVDEAIARIKEILAE